METTRTPASRTDRTVALGAAVAACVVALASLAYAEPSAEYALDGASFDVAPTRIDTVRNESNDALATVALHATAWNADESASGTRPDSAH